MKYRVLIEIGEDHPKGEWSQKSELCGTDNDFSETSDSIGRALASVIHGICTNDEPMVTAVVSALMNSLHTDWDVFDAIGEASNAWWKRESAGDRALNEVCRVVVLKDFMATAIYATVVDELPKGERAGRDAALD